MSFFPLDTLIILPSRLAVNGEKKRLLDQNPSGVVLDPRLHTFENLFNKLCSEFDFKAREIGPLGRDMILDSLLQEREYFTLPAGGNPGPGLRRHLLDLISHLKESGVTPIQFEEIGRVVEGGKNWTGLAGLYADYEQALAERGLIDRAGMRLAIITALERGHSFESLADIRRIIIRGFNLLTPFQLKMARALRCVSERVEVSLPCPEWVLSLSLASDSAADSIAVNPFQETLRLLKELESLGQEGRGLDLRLEPPGGSKPAALTWLADNFFKGGGATESPPDPSGCLRVLAAPGRYQEVEAMGRLIANLLDRGVAPERIAVAFHDLGPYGQLVEDVFRRFNLPLYMRRGAPLHIQAPVRILRALLELSASHFERDLVLDALASPYLDFGLEIQISRVVELTLKAGVTDERAGGGWDLNLDRLARFRPDDRADIEHLRGCVRELKSAVAPLSEPQTWAEFEQNALNLFNSLKLRENIRSGSDMALRRDIPALDGLLTCLENLRRAAEDTGRGQARHTPDELASGLARALNLEGRNIGESAPETSGIKALNARDLEGLQFDHLFLGGLNEGEFPAIGSNDSIIPDDGRRALNRRLGQTVLTTSASDYRREELVFYFSAVAASDTLYLSYCNQDEEGRTRLPSALLDDVLRLWPDGRIEIESLALGGLPPLDEALSEDEVVEGLIWRFSNQARQNEDDLKLAGEVLGGFAVEPGRRERWDWLVERVKNMDNGRDEGQTLAAQIPAQALSSWLESLKARHGAPRVSPTFLEDYGRCPFYFWAARVLKLDALEEAGEELSALDEGSIVHRIISGFFRQCQEKNRLPLRGDPREEETLLETANQVLDEAEGRYLIGRRPLWIVKRKGILALLKRWLAKEQGEHSDKLPAYFEWDFDGLEMPLLSGQNLFFHGRIDRIDLSADEGEVIDYKVSSNESKYRKMLGETSMGRTSFQAPIYQLAAARSFNRPAQARYYLLRSLNPLKPSISTQSAFFAEADDERRRMKEEGRDNFLNNLEQTWVQIETGTFPPAPQIEECDYCPFRLSCRRSGLEEEA